MRPILPPRPEEPALGSPPNTHPPRGTRDLLPAEVELRDHVTQVILATYRRHGFARIETPALERIELLTGGFAGEDEKLIYRILKRGRKLDLTRADLRPADLADLGLRFDLTVPLARYYAHHQAQLPRPFKSIQVGPVWRAERPQKGRWRQFTQCDIDVLGEAGPVAEMELILATADVLASLGLERFTLRLNDRRILQALVEHAGFDRERLGAVCICLDKLDKLGLSGVLDELRGAGHPARAVAALEQYIGPAEGRLEALESVLTDVAAPFKTLEAIMGAVAESLAGRGEVVFDPALVRGMGYYTGPIFEVSVECLPFSIAGGGRYDGLVGRMLGREVPACGFSIGFERLLLVLQERGLRPARASRRVALLYSSDRLSLEGLAAAAQALRDDGTEVSLMVRRTRLNRQLAELAESGFDGFALFEGGAASEERPLSPA